MEVDEVEGRCGSASFSLPYVPCVRSSHTLTGVAASDRAVIFAAWVHWIIKSLTNWVTCQQYSYHVFRSQTSTHSPFSHCAAPGCELSSVASFPASMYRAMGGWVRSGDAWRLCTVSRLMESDLRPFSA